MTVASYTGEINTNGEWATIASLTSFTFVEDTPYWIQIQNIAEIKIASAEFTIHNEKFKFTQLEDDIYIRTNERVVLTILETTENGGGGGGGTITVDSALSNSSKNPVQNKIIYAALGDKQDTSTAVTHTASTAVGSATKGAYIASNGAATEMTYSLEKSVPSNAVFTDTTYNAFTGADGTNAGAAGLVPAPGATDNTKFLKGDGTFAIASVMPSSTTSSQTPTSGAEYTAPWDGYYTLVFSVDAGKTGDAILVNTSNNIRSYVQYTGQVSGGGTYIPVTKGQKVNVIFTSDCSDPTLVFTYANTYVGS